MHDGRVLNEWDQCATVAWSVHVLIHVVTSALAKKGRRGSVPRLEQFHPYRKSSRPENKLKVKNLKTLGTILQADETRVKGKATLLVR